MNFLRWKSGLPAGVPFRITRRWKKTYRIAMRIRMIEEHGMRQAEDITKAFVGVR